jgi:hypothetical protein
LKPWTLPIAATLLAAIVVVPPLISINRFHNRIAESISQGIGRPVRMSSVKMRLLPRPGFEIADFVVEEDPAFGAEPILRAAEVTAYVRLLSLWRGRLEIARIAFDEPSINLVRDSQGRWNFDSLVSQAAQIPKAPTGQPHAGSLPRFPYIDASDARINFKFGNEKMPFSFFNADLAVWLENPGEWRVQFAAQPVRTDLTLDLANTGIVKIDGSLHRAPTLTQMPGVLHAEWSSAPLGQLSRLLAGSDADWRGDLDITADMTGSADHASLKVLAKGRGIHRVEFEPRQPLDVDITCQAQFTRLGRSFDGITCLTPTGDGHLLLTGSVHGLPAKPDPALSLEVNNMPLAMAFDGLRLMRSGFAPMAQATGRVDGNFSYAASAISSTRQLHGGATVNGATIALPSLPKPVTLPVLHLMMNTDAAATPKRQPRPRHRSRTPPPAAEPALLLEPFALASPSGMTISGVFSRSGFSVHAGGLSSVDQVISLGKEFRLVRNSSLNFAAKGTADLDLTVRGAWVRPVADSEHPVAPVSLEGSLKIHNAEAIADFLAHPLEIVSAQTVLGGNQMNWTASSISYGPVHADGTLSYPVFCQAEVCLPRFTLHLASLDAGSAQSALLGAKHHGELVQQWMDRFASEKRSWPAVAGSIAIGMLTVGKLTVRDVDTAVSIDGNTLEIKSLSGKALDGSLRLHGAITALGSAPRYQMDVNLDRATAAATAALFDETWGPGSIDLTAALEFSGFEPAQLLSSTTGKFHWEWSKGGLPLAASEAEDSVDPLKPAQFALAHFDEWSADGTIANSALSLEKSRVANGKSSVPITGTISFARELNLAQPAASEAGAANPVKITGTLQNPLASSAPVASAQATTP